MTSWIKDPNETLDYSVNWSRWLGEDTISSSTWVDVTSGIIVASSSNTTTAATVWLSGGTAGSQYSLTNRIVTAGGRTADRTRTVSVQDR